MSYDLNRGSKVLRVFEWQEDGTAVPRSILVKRSRHRAPYARHLVFLKKRVLPSTGETVYVATEVGDDTGLVCFVPCEPPERWTYIQIVKAGSFSVYGQWVRGKMQPCREAWKSIIEYSSPVHPPLTGKAP